MNKLQLGIAVLCNVTWAAKTFTCLVNGCTATQYNGGLGAQESCKEKVGPFIFSAYDNRVDSKCQLSLSAFEGNIYFSKGLSQIEARYYIDDEGGYHFWTENPGDVIQAYFPADGKTGKFKFGGSIGPMMYNDYDLICRSK